MFLFAQQKLPKNRVTEINDVLTKKIDGGCMALASSVQKGKIKIYTCWLNKSCSFLAFYFQVYATKYIESRILDFVVIHNLEQAFKDSKQCFCWNQIHAHEINSTKNSIVNVLFCDFLNCI